MIPGMPTSPAGDTLSLDQLTQTILNGVQAVNRLADAISAGFPQATGTSTSATGGAASLPANPDGFLVLTLPDGTSAKVPYYR